jgi:hypothetical protein
MENALSRRNALQFLSASAAAPLVVQPLFALGATNETARERASLSLPVSDAFPSHPPELIRETVTVAHFDLRRLREIVDSRPSLAKAAWDWGFGDWEDALGAASHMGNRAIAEYLLAKGARPSLFSAAMLGNLDAVKAFIAAQPGAQAIRGPHSISLLAHARVGGEAARPVYDYLQSLAGSDTDAPAALADTDAARLTGTYTFGIGITQQIVIDSDVKVYSSSKMYAHAPQLNFTRKGAMPRPLFHLGELAFYPAGATAARVQFAADAQGMLMAVTDGDFTMTARRAPDAK